MCKTLEQDSINNTMDKLVKWVAVSLEGEKIAPSPCFSLIHALNDRIMQNYMLIT